MAQGKFHLATVRPRIDLLGNVEYENHDVLFDWHRFEIPRGGCSIKSFNMIVAGLDGAARAAKDMELFFAKSVNGVAPPSLGNPNSDSRVKVNFTACRTHMIAHKLLDGGAMENSDTYTLSYNMWDQTVVGDQVQNQLQPGGIMLQGDTNYPGTTQGYQSVWIAAVAMGAFTFGTGVLLNQASDQLPSSNAAQPPGPVALVTDGVDADDVFAVGDEIMSYLDANGATPGVVGTVIAVAPNLLTVDKVTAGFADDSELCFRGPIQFNFGLEY